MGPKERWFAFFDRVRNRWGGGKEPRWITALIATGDWATTEESNSSVLRELAKLVTIIFSLVSCVLAGIALCAETLLHEHWEKRWKPVDASLVLRVAVFVLWPAYVFSTEVTYPEAFLVIALWYMATRWVVTRQYKKPGFDGVTFTPAEVSQIISDVVPKAHTLIHEMYQAEMESLRAECNDLREALPERPLFTIDLGEVQYEIDGVVKGATLKAKGSHHA